MQRNLKDTCILHDKGRESAEKDAVIDRDCLQDTADYIHNPKNGTKIQPGKDAERHKTSGSFRSGITTTAEHSIMFPGPCRVSEKASEAGQGSGKETRT